MALEYKNTQPISSNASNSFYTDSAKLIASGVSTIQGGLQSLADSAKLEKTKALEKNFTNLAITANSTKTPEEAALLQQQYDGADLTAMFGDNALKASSLLTNLPEVIAKKEFDEKQQKLANYTQEKQLLDMKEASFLDEAKQLYASGNLNRALDSASKLTGPAAQEFSSSIRKEIKQKTINAGVNRINTSVASSLETGNFSATKEDLRKIFTDESDNYSLEEKNAALDGFSKFVNLDRTLTPAEQLLIDSQTTMLNNEVAGLNSEIAKLTDKTNSYVATKNRIESSPAVTSDNIKLLTETFELASIDENNRSDAIANILKMQGELAQEGTYLGKDKGTSRTLSLGDMSQVAFSKDILNWWNKPEALKEKLKEYIISENEKEKQYLLDAARLAKLSDVKYRVDFDIKNSILQKTSAFQSDNKQSFNALSFDTSGKFGETLGNIKELRKYDWDIEKVTKARDAEKALKSATEENNSSPNTTTPEVSTGTDIDEVNTNESNTTDNIDIFKELNEQANAGKKANAQLEAIGLNPKGLDKNLPNNLVTAVRIAGKAGKADLLIDKIADLYSKSDVALNNSRNPLENAILGRDRADAIRSELKSKLNAGSVGKQAYNFVDNLFSDKKTRITKEAVSKKEANEIDKILNNLDSNATIPEIMDALLKFQLLN